MGSQKDNFGKNNNQNKPEIKTELEESRNSQAPDISSDPLARRRALYATFGYDIERERQAVIEAARPFGGRILEAGTGKGHFALTLAREGFNLVSFDLSQEQLRIARENLEKNGLAHLVELRQEDGENLSFADNSFDTIFSVNMVHHLKNPFRVISELIRVLSPSGKLIITDFSPEGMAMMAEVHRLEGDTHEESPVGIAEVEEFLKRAGFKVQRFRTKYEITLVAVKS